VKAQIHGSADLSYPGRTTVNAWQAHFACACQAIGGAELTVQL
jgi:hypothetical protein